MKLKPVKLDRKIPLGDKDARAPKGAPTGDALDEEMDKQVERISDLQKVFYADGRYALLIVLQGRDASGKDGTIRKVFRAVNPLGCAVSSFKAPTDEELRHDYLWRTHRKVPERGMIGIFNRSHYEDVLAVRVHALVPKKVWSARYEQINDFERMLTENRVVILKFMLHVSRDEQKRRFNERLEDETKNWKFREGDLKDRDVWGEFTKAYRAALTKCSTDWAPWYVVPSDDEEVRNLLVARTIADTLDAMNLRYPKLDPALKDLTIE